MLAKHKMMMTLSTSSSRGSPPPRRLAAAARRWISASQLTIEKVVGSERFDSRPAKEDLVFGTTLSDHMLQVEWDSQNAWGTCELENRSTP